MEYLICEDDTEYDSRNWYIEEFEGNLIAAEKYFARKIFYGGDEDGKPEEYELERDEIPTNVYIIPLKYAKSINFSPIEKEYFAWHEKEKKKLIEIKDRNEYERLKKKYGNN